MDYTWYIVASQIYKNIYNYYGIKYYNQDIIAVSCLNVCCSLFTRLYFA